MASIFNGSLLRAITLQKCSKIVSACNGTANFCVRSAHTDKVNPKLIREATEETDITKSVFISQSNDIFTNLAIEDWIYRNTDFNKHHILLIWRNAPCVVVGRHQNPWLEANMEYLAEEGIDIARRNSGGGAVYHDKGNLNLTFFTPRERYNRKANLELITRAVFREWGLNVDISDREDLLLNNYHKVSGTASKLGRPSAYHHCTLLVDANRSRLRNSLHKGSDEIETNATRSLPSPVRNLKEANYTITPELLLAALGWEYLRTTPLTLRDGGNDLISKQRGFQLINPTDKWFPGLAKIRDEFISWDWRFGKTPKFMTSRTFPVTYDGVRTTPAEEGQEVTVRLSVEKGEVADVSLKMPSPHTQHVLTTGTEVLASLQGRKFSSQTLNVLEKSLVLVEKENNVRTALRA